MRKLAAFVRANSAGAASRAFNIPVNSISTILKHRLPKIEEELKKAKKADAKAGRKRKSFDKDGRVSEIAIKANENRVRKKKKIGLAFGPDRTDSYKWLDEVMDGWITQARLRHCVVTPKMCQHVARVHLARQFSQFLRVGQMKYWYSSFKTRKSWSLRRKTTARRKQYSDAEGQQAIARYCRYLRRLKLKHRYPSELIINFDEVPTWFDMASPSTLAKSGLNEVPIATCNAEKLRYTVGLAVSGAGHKLRIQVVFRRVTPDKTLEDRTDGIEVWFAEKGNTTGTTMVDLCRVNFLEHLKKYGGGPGGKRGLIILDAASSHLRPCVRKCIEDELNCDLAVIPASMTHKLQCIDTHVGKSFKDGMYNAWANWMLSGEQTILKSGNRQKASHLQVLGWCKEAWEGVQESTILKGAKKTFMTSEVGAPVFWTWPDVPEVIESEKKKLTDRENVRVVKSMDPESQKAARKLAKKLREEKKRAKKMKEAPKQKKRKRTTSKKKVSKKKRVTRKKKR